MEYDSFQQFVEVTGHTTRDSLDLDIMRMLCFPEHPDMVAKLTAPDLAKKLQGWMVQVKEKNVPVFTNIAPRGLTHESIMTPYELRQVVHTLESNAGLVPSYAAVVTGIHGGTALRLLIGFAEALVSAPCCWARSSWRTS